MLDQAYELPLNFEVLKTDAPLIKPNFNGMKSEGENP